MTFPFNLPIFVIALLGFMTGYFLNTKVLAVITGFIIFCSLYTWATIPPEGLPGVIPILVTVYGFIFLIPMWVTAKRYQVLKLLKSMRASS